MFPVYYQLKGHCDLQLEDLQVKKIIPEFVFLYESRIMCPISCFDGDVLMNLTKKIGNFGKPFQWNSICHIFQRVVENVVKATETKTLSFNFFIEDRKHIFLASAINAISANSDNFFIWYTVNCLVGAFDGSCS